MLIFGYKDSFAVHTTLTDKANRVWVLVASNILAEYYSCMPEFQSAPASSRSRSTFKINGEVAISLRSQIKEFSRVGGDYPTRAQTRIADVSCQ
jgi:hypothetical protein